MVIPWNFYINFWLPGRLVFLKHFGCRVSQRNVTKPHVSGYFCVLNMLVIFSSKLKQGTNLIQHIYMLAESCSWGTTAKCQNGTFKVARKDLNIEEVWNPVCCQCNKIVTLMLRNTSSRILNKRSWYKLALIFFFHYILSKFELMTSLFS